VVDRLLEAFVVEVGLSDVGVGSHQLELAFAVRENQDLCQRQLVHTDVEGLLFTLALYELIEDLELLLQLLRNLIFYLSLLVRRLLVVVTLGLRSLVLELV
jgi:hypothetical protein